MSQAYSNPKRANDPHALPDVEVFEANTADCPNCGTSECVEDDDAPCQACGYLGTPWDNCRAGWYWWSCFPGCLPDSDPHGPFATEAEALADAQEGSEDDE